jgi:Family of unknown function (DUF6084)
MTSSQTPRDAAGLQAAPDLDFACREVVADPYAAGPTAVFKMTAQETSGVRVHAAALRCQVRVEPIQRHYTDREASRVLDLFGDRPRWGQTLQPMQLAFLTQVLPSFSGACDFDLVMPCSYDIDVAAHKYLAALEDGDIPLILLFSGTVFSGTPGSIQIAPVPWHKETRVRVPVAVWRAAMDAHFPGQRWIRVDSETYDRLASYRAERGLTGWGPAFAQLLERGGP